MKKLFSLLLTVALLLSTIPVNAYTFPESIPEGLLIAPNPAASQTVTEPITGATSADPKGV